MTDHIKEPDEQVVEVMASELVKTGWDWRNARPQKHTTGHYSADCPLFTDPAGRYIATRKGRA